MSTEPHSTTPDSSTERIGASIDHQGAVNHDAHIQAWLWHLRGWRHDGQFHGHPKPPNAADDFDLSEIRACFKSPMKLGRRRQVELLIGRRIATVTVERIRAVRRGRPTSRTVLDAIADETLKLLAKEWRKSELPRLRKGKTSSRSTRALVTPIIRDLLLNAPNLTAASIRRTIDNRGASGEYLGPIPDESLVRAIVRDLRSEFQRNDPTRC